ncbi:hypothetical protein BSKO_10627 [Bryopsis sp. KO-2023]|nr:hypothetical protein BSKO_10627 [Bryopsis sp. KO-2023]
MSRLLPPRLSDAELLAKLFSGSGSQGGGSLFGGGSSGLMEIFNTFLSSGVCSGEEDPAAKDASHELPSGVRGLVSGTDDLLLLMANFTQALGDLNIVLGTPAGTSSSLFLEPALLPASEDENEYADGLSDDDNSNDAPGALVEPLYVTMEDCQTLSASQQRGLRRASCVTELLLGRTLECVSLIPSWRETAEGMDDEIYCGWRDSTCIVEKGRIVKLRQRGNKDRSTHEFPSALYDWQESTPRKLDVNIRVNDSIIISSQAQNPPRLQRWNQPMNMAANAFLRYKMKDNSYSVRLRGLKGMPKTETQLEIDFSSLLGPLFFMWLLQLLLPVNVNSLMYEKENHLRIMMKMQGLDDRAFYIVNYMWQLFLYVVFIIVFVAYGSFIGLTMFTRSSLSVLAVFFFLWGNMMIAWGFWISSIFRTAKVAVHSTVMWVIGSGLVSNLMLSQIVIRGPYWLANVMQIVPSFGLYRGLWELAQYAFLASGNGADGLTWEKLNDEGNGMKWVFVSLSAEWAWTMFFAWYNDQVLGYGTGVRRHPLFLFGSFKRKSGSSQKTKSPADASKEAEIQEVAASLSSMLSGAPQNRGVHATVNIASPRKTGKNGKNADSGSRGTKKSVSLASTNMSTCSRSSKGTSRVVGGTPYDDDDVFMDAGSYWGSAGSPPASPSGASPPLLISREACADMGTPQDVEGQVTNKRTVSRPNGVPFADGEGPDVASERLRVEQVWEGMALGKDTMGECTILLRNLRKIYPTQRKGCPPKVAVENLSVGIDRNHCFGLLGPNGAGKTTTIRMMEGFLEPSEGSVLINGMDTKLDMPSIYSIMGVCPQHDLLWDDLTAREHLMFYGKLKNLHGQELDISVNASLKSVNLLAEGVGDRRVQSYSGGMKRRLSVAISLIGDPLVVYLDEPSTGLDPSSRRLLWDVIRKAKKSKAVVLTTHSMEEAEALCDCSGIFVNGRLVCVGNPKDLTSRYGGYLQFSLTTPSGQEVIAAEAIYKMCPTARPVYSLGGTQKFELPMADVQLEEVFDAMARVQSSKEFSILDWGVSNATLEEVFIKITREAGVKMTAFTS